MTWWPNGRLLGFDLETTGVDVLTARPVSYCFALKRGESPERFSGEHAIVDPGGEVPDEAAAIHGITTERAKAEGRELRGAVEHMVQRIVWAASESIPLVGMNIAYDLTIVDRLARELLGAGLEDSGWAGGPVLDVLVLDKAHDRYRKGSRTLGALCEHYEVAHEEPHTAVGHVVASLNVLLVMTERHRYLGLKTPAQLHRYQARWRRQQVEGLSEHFVTKGEPPIDNAEYGWPLYDYLVTESNSVDTRG